MTIFFVGLLSIVLFILFSVTFSLAFLSSYKQRNIVFKTYNLIMILAFCIVISICIFKYICHINDLIFSEEVEILLARLLWPSLCILAVKLFEAFFNDY
jgi:hypothetical protein